MSRAWATLAFVAATTLSSRQGWAIGEPAPAVRVRIVECETAQIPVSRFLDMLKTELAPRTVELVYDATSEPTRWDVQLCQDGASVALLQVFRDGRAVSQRQVDLSDVDGDNRVRTLAAVVAETASASTEVALQAEKPRALPPAAHRSIPAPTAEAPTVSGTVQLVPRSSVRKEMGWYSGAALFVREYSRPGSPFFGTNLHIGYSRVAAGLSLAWARTTAQTGEITHSFAVLSTTVDLARFFDGPQLIPRLHAESGVAWAVSRSSQALTTTKTRAAILSAAHLELALRQRIAAQAAFELRCAGGYSGGLTASENGIPRSSTSGWVASATLGANYFW